MEGLRVDHETRRHRHYGDLWFLHGHGETHTERLSRGNPQGSMLCLLLFMSYTHLFMNSYTLTNGTCKSLQYTVLEPSV